MEINGYTLITPLKNENSGFSTWGFCQRGGQEYFIKEFINPVYPVDDPYLSEELKQRKLQTCIRFENKLTALFSAVNRASNGNLVRIEEFFRHGSKYYVVTKKLSYTPKSLEEIAMLPDIRKEFLIRLVLHTMMCMHNEGVVHGDIKATNLLVHFDAYRIMAKVIDFDGGFLADSPPQKGDEITGDMAYLAPEVLKCMCGEFAPLSCKIDVFAMGVLLHQYWTGQSPLYDTEQYDCIAEAMLCGDEVRLDGRIPEKIAGIIHDMLQLEPWDRISMEEAYHRMMGTEPVEEAVSATVPVDSSVAVPTDSSVGRSTVIVYSRRKPVVEETVPEAATKVAIPEEAAAEGVIPEEPAAEEAIPEGTVAEEAIPEEPAAEEAIPEEPAAEGVIPEEPAIEDPIPEEPAAEEAIPEGTVAEEAIPEEPAAEEAIPEEPAIEEPIPEEAAAEETIPEETIADETVVEVVAEYKPAFYGFHEPDPL